MARASRWRNMGRTWAWCKRHMHELPRRETCRLRYNRHIHNAAEAAHCDATRDGLGIADRDAWRRVGGGRGYPLDVGGAGSGARRSGGASSCPPPRHDAGGARRLGPGRGPCSSGCGSDVGMARRLGRNAWRVDRALRGGGGHILPADGCARRQATARSRLAMGRAVAVDRLARSSQPGLGGPRRRPTRAFGPVANHDRRTCRD